MMTERNDVTIRKSILALAALAASIGYAPAGAHHSFAMFDQTKALSLKGQVAQFQWTNPHAFIELDVTDSKGKVVRWSIELNSPNNLTRQGWRRSSLKPGETVTVTFNPLRNGKSGGLFNKVVFADGRSLNDGRPSNSGPINVPTR
ncbi:hypothetical protein FHS91_003558 [Sphingobium xanthum]|jgi:hypothetical protein|uniref:DUF6152 family protein n=1 Tax=Sphingobium xanthum TaxID=1387165 RepID=UPI001C8B16CD|nr:DUF6152 family protein [Sphingobium xanthum]